MRNLPMPRVMHVMPAVFGERGEVGGGERYAYELARAMSRHTPTRVVSFGDDEQRWCDGHLYARILPRTRYVRGDRFNPISPDIMGEILQADVIHLHQKHVLASSTAALFARMAGKPVFVTDHGGGGLDFSWYVPTDAFFHCHLHVSAFSRSSAGQETDSRARVILGGVDARRFAPRPEKRTARALFVGRVTPHKGVHDLIEALPSGAGLDIVGPETDSSYASALRSLAVGRDVRFRGPVPEPELIECYGKALCVVLPSVYESRFGGATAVPELLGQTLLEAMACGTPVIATKVGGLPETVIHGTTGFIVEPGDPEAIRCCLEHLLGDPELVERLGRAAAEHTRMTFDWDQVVERCLSAYRSLLPIADRG